MNKSSDDPYWGASFNNGHDVTGGITAGLGGVWDPTGDGVTSPTGSDYNFAVGVVTDYDLAQGAIDHAVRIAISADALKSPGATCRARCLPAKSEA